MNMNMNMNMNMIIESYINEISKTIELQNNSQENFSN